MRSANGLLTAAALLHLAPVLLVGASAAQCELPKGLYEDRLALTQTQGPAEPANGALLPAGTVTPASKLTEIDGEYRRFLAAVAAATQAKDESALKACCDRASGDRAGALVCGLSLYLQGGRKQSAAFLEQFPNGRKEAAILPDLEAIFGKPGVELYPPKGPGYRLIDELFLLVMDEREVAINRYFSAATHSTGDQANYMNGQIRTFLKEAPAVVVNQWLVLRRYRPKLKQAAQSLIASSTPAEMQKLVRAVRTFCGASNPDCPDILKLYAGK